MVKRVPKVSNAVLNRSLTLPLLVLYGLGVTIGAGIYVLVGATASKAGFYAPVSFLLAALVVAFTGFSYAEMGTRYPVSSGEAVYVRNGFSSRKLALLVGLMVAGSGVVSAAAVSIGAVAYIGHFINVSDVILTVGLILILGLVASWGILESVTIAALFTLIEVSGLCFVVYYSFNLKPDLLADIGELVPPMEAGAWAGIMSAGLLAFFAFVGFEDIANVAEEVKNPRRNLPLAIILTLFVATAIYFMVVSVVILVVPMEVLRESDAPLALVFENASPTTRGVFTFIATIATINGVLIQIIMASRVLYGLATKAAPKNAWQIAVTQKLSMVNPLTRTPLVATGFVVGIILCLALFFPISRLAEATSSIILIVFIMVNLALIRLKMQKKDSESKYFHTSLWVPICGALSCLLLLLSGFM